MMDILFLEPVFKERIWGGTNLTQFGYQLPYLKTGECWAISAHPNGESTIKSGRFKGLTLSQVFQTHKELFNHIPYDRFPLLTKILDANDDLSVQVHPDDAYALEFEQDLGKTECWYVLDAAPDAYIIYGHTALSKDDFVDKIQKQAWGDLLIKKPVKTGDFIYVPSGTIHALGKGILILETQQSSDTTYRLYDYDRIDDQGHMRELHIDKSIEVSKIPHQNQVLDIKDSYFGTAHITHYVGNQFFTIQKWTISDTLRMHHDYFKLMSVIEGSGRINGQQIKKGDHFIVCANVDEILIEGALEFIVSWV